MSESRLPPIAWYVHLPFCTSKCGYCDFYSLPTRPEMIESLVSAVCREIAARDPRRPVATIFVGGGTPTVLPADALRTILQAIPGGEAIARAPHALRSEECRQSCLEFTVEANPSSADELKLELLRECGVNRVSFGAQSFQRDELSVLERLHDPAHIAEAVSLARQAGFDNVNLDLIFGIPGQTMERWTENLHRAIDLAPEHLSCYSLMYEEGTALTKRRRLNLLTPCDEELEADMYERAIDVLAAAGYEHYEVSNFARPGRRCRHNMVYWRNAEYVGIGPSAVSYIDGLRTKNVPDVRRYIDGVLSGAAVVVESERLEPAARARETAVQMLRLIDGIDLADFQRRTGFVATSMFADQIARLEAWGHVTVTPDRIGLTRRGLLAANRVLAEFV